MDFGEYLRELGDASSKLKASELARLSGLSAEQADLFAASWPGIDVRRRREVVEELLELEEDNVECDVEAGLRAVISGADEIDEVRARALEAMGAHDNAWVRQALSGAYESGIRRLKVAAVHAMGRSCEPR